MISTAGPTPSPQRLQFVDELPRLPTGKLLRRVLKDRLRDQPQAGFSLR